jgi:hypothetical protein
VHDVRQPKDEPDATDPTTDTSSTVGRIVLAAALFVLAGAIVVLIFWLKSDSLTHNALLVATVAVLTGTASVVLPLKVRNRSVPFVAVAAGTAGLLAAVLAIPELSSPSQSTSQVTPSSEPLAWNLDFNQPGGYCESFIVSSSFLKSLPDGENLNAEWVYKHGGATTTTEAVLSVQGRSEDVVILSKFRIIDVHMREAPTGVSQLYPCHEQGTQVIPSRYYQLVFVDGEGHLSQWPGLNGRRTVEPIRPFPLQVTNSHAELFRLKLASHEPCLCSWRLEMEWSSGGRSGKTIIDRGFTSIRTAFDPEVDRSYARNSDGTWVPPLPN